MYTISKSGTLLKDGVEYNEKPPAYVIKSMRKEHAILLAEMGQLRLHSYAYYRSYENPDLADEFEGLGMNLMQQHPINSGSANEVLIFCTSSITITRDLSLSYDPSYDTIIRIRQPGLFGSIIAQALTARGMDSYAHVGLVTYDRGIELPRSQIANRRWHHNAFQKDAKHFHQEEYRFVFTVLSEFGDSNRFVDIQDLRLTELVEIEKDV